MNKIELNVLNDDKLAKKILHLKERKQKLCNLNRLRRQRLKLENRRQLLQNQIVLVRKM